MDEEEEDFDLVSTESMASCPMKGSTRYRKLFKSIVLSVFGTKAADGLDHKNFIETVLQIEGGTPWDGTEREALFLHVICNQYADASGTNTISWESWEDMKPYYDTKRLKRRTAKRRREIILPAPVPSVMPPSVIVNPPVAPVNSPASPDVSQKRPRFRHLEECELDEYGMTVPEALAEVGLHNHHQLARRVKELADAKHINMHGCRPASNSQGLSIFRNPQELRNLVQFAAFEVLREQIAVDDARATGGPATITPPPRQSITNCPPAPLRANYPPALSRQTPPSTVLFYTPCGADFMPEMEEDHRVFWKDVLKIANVERILQTNDMDRFMERLRVKDTESMMKELAMRCGQHHIRKFGTPVLKDNQRIYTRIMLPMMFATLNDVMHTLLKK